MRDDLHPLLSRSHRGGTRSPATEIVQLVLDSGAVRLMPSGIQRGSVRKRDASWQARFYDDTGARRSIAGFPTKTAAVRWLADKTDEVAALRRGDRVAVNERPQTVDALLDLFLDKHGRTIDPATTKKLTAQLKHVRAEFSDRHPDSLRRIELEDWRELLPPGSRHDVFRALRQAVAWATDRGLAERNATGGIRNPKRKRHERRDVHPFESWEEVRTVVGELDVRYRALPIVAVGCGHRPEELFGLHRSESGVLYVRRRFTGGELKEGGKTPGSVRAVPLRRVVLDALDAIPPRIDTPVLFPAPRGGLHRHRAVPVSGVGAALGRDRASAAVRLSTHVRHWAIEAGVQLWYLATVMGTSVTQLEDTYARWLKRTDDRLRAAFDAYDESFGAGMGPGSTYADERT